MAEACIETLMFGPSGVGKTSLLAMMHREINRQKDLAGILTLTPRRDDRTLQRLDRRYHELAEVVNGPRKFQVVTAGMKGTEGFVTYSFDLCFRKHQEAALLFHDFRGGALFETTSGDEEAHLDKLIKNSQIIINVIDAVGLMAFHDDPTSDAINGYNTVFARLKERIDDEERPLLVLIPLIKCESYDRMEEKMISMLERRHDQLLSYIQESTNAVAVVMPVHTLGCLRVYSTRYVPGSGPTVQYKLVGKEIRPRDLDQLLLYILAFAKRHVDSCRSWWDNMWNWLMGYDKKWAEAFEKVLRSRKKFRAYGNVDLLKE